MKPILAALCLAATAALLQPAATARAQSGILLKTFDLRAGKLLLDPNQPRLYVTLPADNSLAVIDTNTNAVIAQFFIGITPADLTISRDGARLYVANRGSTTAAIGVVDLTGLTVLPSMAAPFAPAAIVAGLDNRLYVLAADSQFNPVAQINATTGETQGTFGYGVFSGGFLKISPDGKTLYFADYGVTPCTLGSADVSNATPGNLQLFRRSSDNGNSLALSHNGSFLVHPNGTGDGPGDHVTALIPTNNLGGAAGYFPTGAYPGLAAFSPDDKLLYQVQLKGGPKTQNELRVFDTTTFAQVDAFPDPRPGTTNGDSGIVTSLAINQPNGYMYMATVGYINSSSTSSIAPNNLVVVSTRKPFFNGSVALSDGFYYLKFASGVPFGYYNLNSSPYLYHVDLGFEYPFDAVDGVGGVYLYDFTSETFWYTSSGAFPYLYDFTLGAWLYYFPDPSQPDHYNTDGTRYFYNFDTGQIISK